MKFKSRKKPKILYKAAILLVGGALVALAFMINIDTSSWFTSQAQQGMKVTAAKTEDIIKHFEITGNENSSREIEIQKISDLGYNPVVYFSIEGEIRDYILHINPVILEENDIYSIPINLNINNRQFIKLMCKPNGCINGSIRLKYLNNYIDEEREISFSKKYLRREFWNILKSRNNSKDIVDLMEHMAQYVDWENEERSSEKLEANVAAANISNIESENSNKSVTENIMPNINKIILSPYQNQIFNVVAPRLAPHIEKLYATIENLVVELNEKISEIELLNQFIEECKIKIEALGEEKLILENEKTVLIEDVESLENTNTELSENINELNIKIDDLTDKNSTLSKSNKKLRSKNSSLSEDVTTLTNENIMLKEEVTNLKLQIEELTTKEDNDTTVPEEVYGD